MTSDPGTSAAATFGGTYVGNWSLPPLEVFEPPLAGAVVPPLVLVGTTGAHAASAPRPPAASINQPPRRSIARRVIPPRSLMRSMLLNALLLLQFEWHALSWRS